MSARQSIQHWNFGHGFMGAKGCCSPILPVRGECNLWRDFGVWEPS